MPLQDLPVVIAGSNKIKNNHAGFEASLENLNNDLCEKYPVAPQKVIVAGFSGGARMALYYGTKRAVHGIIMFGAGPGQRTGGLQNRQVCAVSGTRDFNFVEQYRPLFIDTRRKASYMNDYFRGTHDWPSEPYIREAVIFCLREEPGPYRALSRKLSTEFLKASDSLQSGNDLLLAGKALEKAWYFAVGNQQRRMSARKIDAFKTNPDRMACERKIETLLKGEDNIKRLYVENLADPDTAWWSTEYNRLVTRINTCSDPAEKDSYYRLKGFLGIYLYSRINTLLNQHNSGEIMDRLIRIYGEVEPESEDLIYFKGELSRLKAMSN